MVEPSHGAMVEPSHGAMVEPSHGAMVEPDHDKTSEPDQSEGLKQTVDTYFNKCLRDREKSVGPRWKSD